MATTVMTAQEEARLRRRLGFAVALAIAADFVLLSILEPEQRRLPLPIRIASFAIGTGFFALVGLWLGRRTWPRRGRRLARHLLRRALRSKKTGIVLLTDRPDFPLSLRRRIIEVVGFAAGSIVILTAVLTFLGIGPGLVLATSGLLILLALWGCFIVVPYWVFGRMGMRQVDPVRWLIQPLSRRYADRMRLSNGLLLLVALGAVVNLGVRAGQSGAAALVDGVTFVGHVVAAVLVAAAVGVAAYVHRENALVKDFEEEAVAMGLRDGRGLSDDDFLPRLPPRP